MKASFKNILLFACIISILSIGLIQARGTSPNKIEWGTRPQNFCIPSDQSVFDSGYTMQQAEFFIWKWKYFDPSQSNLYIKAYEIKENYIKLTKTDDYAQSGAVYHYQQMNFENGFELTFNMKIEDDKCNFVYIKKCFISLFGFCIWKDTPEKKILNCGGKGFAVVLHAGGYNRGFAGAGVGYQGLQNVFAIEFDTSTDTSLNDPSNGIERHISVIVNKGEAQANEANSIAWNDQPTTYFKPNQEGSYKYVNAFYKIQYYNKMLRVYINDVLELALYDQFNIGQKLGLDNHIDLIAGVTASTDSDVANTHTLTNFNIKVARPNLNKFTASVVQPIRQVLQYLELAINLYDSCGNPYYPLNYVQYDNPSIFKLVTDANSKDCVQVDSQQNQWQMVIGFKCTVSGNKSLSFTYNGTKFGQNVNIYVNPNTPVNLTTDSSLYNGKVGSIQQFKIQAFDSLNNPAATTSNYIRDLITIQWPKPEQTKNIHTVTQEYGTDNWIVSFEPESTGIHTIKSNLLAKSATLNVQIGDPSDLTSTSKIIYSLADKPSVTDLLTPVIVGTKVQVMVELKDKQGNPSNADANKQNFVLRVVNGLGKQVETVYNPAVNTAIGVNYLFFDFPSNITTTNTYYKLIVSRINSNKVVQADLKCTICQLSLIQGPPYFQNTKALQWNWHLQDHQFWCSATVDERPAGKYCDKSYPTQGGLYMFKGDKFQYYLQFYDQKGNILEQFDFSNYGASLSGNNIDVPIELSLSPYNGVIGTLGFGALLQVKDDAKNRASLARLVGQCDYILTFYKVGSDKKQWYVNIYSDGSDSDAGNGAIAPASSKLTWRDGSKLIQGSAGQQQSLYLTLVNTRGERYNSWQGNDEKDVQIDVSFDNQVTNDPKYNDKCQPAVKLSKPGQFRIDCVFYKTITSQRNSNINLIVNGNRYQVSTKVGIQLKSNYDLYAVIDKSYLVAQSSRQLNDALTGLDYTFQVQVYDSYDNQALSYNDIGQVTFQYIGYDTQYTAPWYCSLIEWFATQFCKDRTTSQVVSVIKTFNGKIALSQPAVYTVTMNSPVVQNVTIKNQYFNNDYFINVIVANPDATKSISKISNFVNAYSAGQNVLFQIIPSDIRGNLFNSNQFTKFVGDFALTVTFNNIKTNVEVIQNISSDKAQLILKNSYVPTVAGVYVFQPTYRGIQIPCSQCQFKVIASSIDSTKTQLTRINGIASSAVVVSQSGPTIIDVTQNSPAFYLNFFDQYLNPANISGIYNIANSQSSLQINYNNQKTNIYSFQAIKISDSQFRVQFDETKTMSGINGTQSQLQYFKQESSIDNCVLTIQLNTTQSHQYQKVQLLNSQSPYDNSDPTTIAPVLSSMTANAGEIKSVVLEVRVANGKLYSFGTDGWYSDINANIKVQGLLNNYTLTKGSFRSTYILTFNETQATNNNGRDVSFSFIFNGKTISGTVKLNVRVDPLTVYQLTLQDPSNDLKACSAGNQQTIRFIARDIYKNTITQYRTGADGLSFTPDLKQNPIILFDSTTSQVRAILQCVNAGTINIKANQPILGQAGQPSLKILTGDVDQSQSFFTIQTQNITAGQSVSVQIYLYDTKGNKILYDQDRYGDILAQFKGYLTFSGNNGTLEWTKIGVSKDNTYLYLSEQIQRSGTHSLIIQYKGISLSYSANRVQVIAADADWDKSTLAIFNSLTQNYQIVSSLSVNQKQFPKFQVATFDTYGNIAILPESWKNSFELYIDGNGFNYSQRFPLTQLKSDVSQFTLIQNDEFNTSRNTTYKDYLEEKTPMDRWIGDDMQNNQNYDLNFKLKITGKTDKKYDLLIEGPQQDPDLSNLPMNISNTVLTPNDALRCRAGENVSFTIETRTINPSLVTIMWDLVDKIKLQFSKDQVGSSTYNYNVVKGDKRGRYIATISCFKAYDESSPNQVTVVIDNQVFTKYKPSLIVSPAKINSVINTDVNATKRSLQSRRVDEPHFEFFQAFDVYNNAIQLTQEKGLNLDILINGVPLVFQRLYTLSGLLKVTLQPNVVGSLYYNFGQSGQFSVNVDQGKFSNEQSFVTQDSSNNLIAGQSVQLIVNPRDMWGNTLDLSTKANQTAFLSENKLSFSIQDPSNTQLFQNQSATFTFDANNKLVVTFNLIIKGNHQFKVYNNGVALRMTQSSRIVVPGEGVLANSIVQQNNMQISSVITEDNYNTIPQYQLILVDQYKNVLDTFNWNKDQLVISLLQNSSNINTFGKKSYVNFTADQVIGNILQFSISDADEQDQYKNIVKSLNAKLRISYQGQSVDYLVNLKGQDGDENVSFGDFNSTLSYVTPSVKFIAGNSEMINIEIMNNQGFKKADADASKISMEFNVQSNGSVASSYSLKACYQATGRGQFICYITGTQAVYNNNFIMVSVKYDGTKLQKQCACDVSPQYLDHVDLVLGSNQTVTADEDAIFKFRAFDMYKNEVRQVLSDQVHIEIQDVSAVTGSAVIPTQQTGQNQTFIKASIAKPSYLSLVEVDGLVAFKVTARTANKYVLTCPQFKQGATQQYYYRVNPGPISTETSVLQLSNNNLTVGEQLTVTLTPYDAFNNLITQEYMNFNQSIKIQYKSSLNVNQSQSVLQLVGNDLQQTYSQTVNAQIQVGVELNGQQITCDRCNVTFVQGPIELGNTKFSIPQQDSTYQELKVLQMAYQANSFTYYANLYDKYNNLINYINSSNTFTGQLSGNDMDLVNLTVSIANSNQNLKIELNNSSDINYVSRLVILNNYTLIMNFQSKNYLFPFEITGNASLTSDAGNGKIDSQYTYITYNYLNLTAGIPSAVQIELRTQQNKRLNRQFDGLASITISDTGDKTVVLKYVLTEGDRYGRYMLNITGTKATISPVKDVQISINNVQVPQQIKIQIDPDVPDFDSTIFYKDDTNIPVDIKQNRTTATAKFSIFDKYGNQYKKIEFSNYFKPQLIQGLIIQDGNVSISQFNGQDNYYYQYTFTPGYPPRNLNLTFIYCRNVENGSAISVPIKKNDSFGVVIVQELDWSKTQITGEDLVGKQVDQNITLQISFADKMKNILENDVKFNVTISGPYERRSISEDNKIIGSQSPISVDSVNNPNKVVISQIMQGLATYNFTIVNNSLTRQGYYKIDLQYIPNKGDLPQETISILKTYMSAGAIDVSKTLLLAPSLENRGNAPLQIAVQTNMTVFAIMRDAFKNKVLKDTDTQLSILVDNWKEKVDYNYTVTNLRNGTYKIDFVSYRTGQLVGLNLIIGGQTFSSAALDKVDIPEIITITPGPCDPLNVISDIDKLQGSANSTKDLTIGKQYQIVLQCRDQFNNSLTNGGEQFSVSLTGYNLNQVKSQLTQANVIDALNGSYIVSFILTWQGNYNVSINLGNKQVPLMNKTLYASPKCQGDNQWYCVDGKFKGQCVSGSYLSCGFNESQYCNNFANPFKCEYGDCVQHEGLCLNKTGFLKCPNSHIFYPANMNSSDICPDQNTQDISRNPMVCPLGFTLCPDTTCVKSSIGCDYSQYKQCEQNLGLKKCYDQTCRQSNECPNRIECSNSSQVICPDNTCANSPLECQLPFECEFGKLCPDQSCRPSLEQCPTTITCAAGQSLCSDGQCSTSCIKNSTIQNPSGFLRLLQNSRNLQQTNNSSIKSSTGCPSSKPLKCPGGECVQTNYQCPTVSTCPIGSVVCPDLSCAASALQCVVNICNPGEVHCHDGKCVKDSALCSTRPICPDQYPILCTNNKCAKDLSECQKITSCPKNLPYRCGAGVCRASSEDCPTLITCPEDKPLKCTDSSCVTQKEDCVKVVEAQKCSTEYPYQCSDGTCSKSDMLCPTQQSCPTNFIRCWNNECAASIEQCPSTSNNQKVCQSNTPYRCPDGSCASEPSNCPTNLICPFERPILCDDGTCKQSNKQCYTHTSCSFGKKRCPDGSCIDQLNECGTPITCSFSKPYKCYDNTCRQNPQDCPAVPTCSDDAPILCPDGTCVSIRDSCSTVFSKCDPSKPVRCEDRNCYSDRSQCPEFNGCPQGLFRCEDNSCLADPKNCPAVKCPPHLSYKCKDGFCVSNKDQCDINNGCPYNKPFKCFDGLCSVNSTGCNNATQKNSSLICANQTFNTYLCEDGSCASDKSKCYNSNGCPQERPLKCASGNCINPNLTSCNVASCPADAPIKCLDGLCVQSSSNCLISLPDVINFCQKDETGFKLGNVVPCADGRCVATSDLCRPVYKCGLNQKRCDDGSCRPDKSMCPKVGSTCPQERPVRCEIGACAANIDSCPKDNGCNNQFPQRCLKTGQCAESMTECEDIYKNDKLPNNCTVDAPIRCSSTNNCIAFGKSCPRVNKCSNNATNPFLCQGNNQCVKNAAECKNAQTSCQAGYFQCPDNSCNQDYSECGIPNGCTVSKPYMGDDGQCYPSPFNGLGEQGPNLQFSCPDYLPYMCASGECVGDQNHCKTLLPCPSDKPNRCADQTCKSDAALCSQKLTICPKSIPILCENGQCVTNPSQCQTAKNMFCTKDSPFQCATGVCVQQPNLCVPESIRNGNAAFSKVINSTYTAFFDPGCAVDQPFRCSDGSCRKRYSNCPVFSGCNNIGLQFRCKSGRCASNATQCAAYDKDIKACANNMTRSPDGYCRVNNVTSYGCPLEKPLMCSSGLCARSYAECAGDSSCKQLSKPFRCADGACVSNQALCSRPLRTYQPEIMQITIGTTETKQFQFIKSDVSNEQFGQITSVAGTLLDKLTNNTETIKKRMLQASNITNEELKALMIRPVLDSDLQNYTVTVLPTRYQYVNDFFPTSEDQLSFHQAVRSPIVNLSSEGQRNTSEEYRFPIILTLQSDILIGSNKSTDYCLARQDPSNQQFVCSSRQLSTNENSLSNSFSYPVLKDGVYTVIFNPQDPEANAQGQSCGFYCQNKGAILGGIIGGLLGFVFLCYVFWRMTRYISKYRLMKQKQENLNKQIYDLNQQSTNIVGQSLGDKAQGIVFVKNDAYLSNENQDKSEELIQVQQQLDKSKKKEKQLEQTNNELNERNKTLLTQIEILRSETYKKGINQTDVKFEMGNMGQKEF